MVLWDTWRSGLAGEGPLERTGNLLGRPLPVEQRHHHAPAQIIGVELGGRSSDALTCLAGRLRAMRAVGQTDRRIARQLATDG